MKFVLSSWGSRGDVEPCAAVGRELVRRGHDVTLAVPPDLVGFGTSAVPNTVGFGPTLQMDSYRDFWTGVFSQPWKVRELTRLMRDVWAPYRHNYAQMSAVLNELAEDADLIVVNNTGFDVQAANVAEYRNIPLATLHWHPLRPNGQIMPFLPPPVCRAIMHANDWLSRGGYARDAEMAQRADLGLPRASGSWPQRIVKYRALEIQAYDAAWFPGLSAEWAKWGDRRPIVGALAMEIPTPADDEILSWIAAGPPPIFFGFGSTPVTSPSDTVAMISDVCAQLGERAVIGAGFSDFTGLPQCEHAKVVGTVNFGAIFPACRAVVHHGGAGTTAFGLRAGMPTLILATDADQALWGRQVEKLGVGLARRLSRLTETSLAADLRILLDPHRAEAAREFSTKMAKPVESVVRAADLMEKFARTPRSRSPRS
ncbi:glycosyltransferase [Mycolicibacterium rhodesiae]|uniref:Glycosyl transferase family 1 n=1 Tax=Mycolicibacterium rhodesiae TaxID=36814 RepID=A0A1X0INM1_MYCRH|nr:glycosyltransferase [Mycolicibacterium rhodesiae]MCV7347671.1 glycosyltransferase [Mycolicibacterium rhodesiae]ORB49223.1 glycosyl transferase family 1 [Mycolicibacterium rhodesiae]